MRVVALDLSLTRTGWAAEDGCGVIIPKDRRGMARLGWILRSVDQLLDAYEPDVVVLEGYSFASKGRAVFSLGELGGVIRFHLWDVGVPYAEVAPGTLKLYATGHGNAGKEEVLAAAIRRLGYEGHDDNEADALWLRTMALDHYNAGVSHVPQAHRKALAKVEWPTITTEAVA